MKVTTLTTAGTIIVLYAALLAYDPSIARDVSLPATFVVVVLTLTLNILDHREHR